MREAQTLGKPVIITNYPTAASQITDEVDGFIVPLENTGCAGGISFLLDNQRLIESVRENIVSMDFSNSKEVLKLYQLL